MRKSYSMESTKKIKRFKNETIRAQWWDYGKEGHYFITFCTANRIHFFGQISDGCFCPSQLGDIAKKIWEEIPNQFSFIELGAFVIMPDHVHGILSIRKNSKITADRRGIDEIAFKGVGSGGVGSDEVDSRSVGSDEVDSGIVRSGIVGSGIVGSRLIATPQFYQLPHQLEDQTKIKDPSPLQHSSENQKSNSTNKALNKMKGGITGDHNPMIHENISRVLRWYKGRCTFEMRKLKPDFRWQSRFYDHIIRNHREYIRIERYIHNNPKNWGKKKNYPL